MPEINEKLRQHPHVEVDPLICAILGRSAHCSQCQAEGASSTLTFFSATPLPIDNGVFGEAHSYGCSRNHFWNKMWNGQIAAPEDRGLHSV